MLKRKASGAEIPIPHHWPGGEHPHWGGSAHYSAPPIATPLIVPPSQILDPPLERLVVFVKGRREERGGERMGRGGRGWRGKSRGRTRGGGEYYQCDYGIKGMGGACLGGGGGAYHLGFVGN